MIYSIVLDMGCARTCFTEQTIMIYAAGRTSTTEHLDIDGIGLHVLMDGSGLGLHKERIIKGPTNSSS